MAESVHNYSQQPATTPSLPSAALRDEPKDDQVSQGEIDVGSTLDSPLLDEMPAHQVQQQSLIASVVSRSALFLRFVCVTATAVVSSLQYPVALTMALYLTIVAINHIVYSIPLSEHTTALCIVMPRLSACRTTAAGDVAFPSPTPPVSDQVVLDYAAAPMDQHDFTSLFALQSRMLDQLLAHSTSGYDMALSMKQAELAVKDLAVVLQASNFSAKDALAGALDDFVTEAKSVGRDLQHLSAKLDGAVDTVIAYNEYALRILTVTRQGSSAAGAHSISGLAFRSAMNLLASEVIQVHGQAIAATDALDMLEERLSDIGRICLLESFVHSASTESLLSELWTSLGGNRAKLSQLTHQAIILRNMNWVRSISTAYVIATTETLLALQAELAELGNKLRASQLPGNMLPMEVHIASLERGVRRLYEERVQARRDRRNFLKVATQDPQDGGM